MNVQMMDNLASRGAHVLSRRASLGGLASAALAASISPEAAKAKKAKNKSCKKQSGACRSSVSAFCEGTTDIAPEACAAALIPCCELLKGCNAGGFYDCLIDALQALEESPQT
jgi:hypothetical protein